MAVVLLAAVDVRRVSQDAGASLDGEVAAGELRSATERASALEASPSVAGENGSRAADLSASARQLDSAFSRFETDAPDDEDLSALNKQTSAARDALERTAAAGTDRERSRAQVRARFALAELSALTQSVSDRLTAAGREGAGEARRRLMLTLLGGLALLVMLMGIFWSKRSSAESERRERRFQALLRNSSDLVIVVEPET